jgi:protein-tyrosine phosphatase
MGNICRSPAAEGFFYRHLQESRIRDMVSVDSAATHSYHIGHSPDRRAIETGDKFDVPIAHLRARRIQTSDFHDFDLIIAMDHNNLADLQAIQPPGSPAELKLMMAFHPGHRDGGHGDEVPDPYYGGMDGFVYMFELLELATEGLLKEVEERLHQEQ